MTEQLSIVGDAKPKSISNVAELAAAREALGLSVSGAAAQLRVAPRQVEALEQGAWDKLPGLAFIKGVLRAYAKILRADLAPLIANLDTQIEKTEVRPAHRLEGKLPETSALGFGEGGNGSKWAWAALVIAGLAALALFFGKDVDSWMPKKPAADPSAPARTEVLPVTPSGAASAQASSPAPGAGPAGSQSGAGSGDSKAVPSLPAAPGVPTTSPGASLNPSQPVAAEAPAAEAAPASAKSTPTKAADAKAADAKPADAKPADAKPAPVADARQGSDGTSGAPRFQVQFGKESWVEIKDATGQVVLFGTQKGGTTQVLKGKPPFSATIGNGTHVKIERIGPDGPGQAVRLPADMPQGIARLTLQ